MSTTQLKWLFMATERDEQGYPKLKVPDLPDPSPRDVYERMLHRNGIHDPETIRKLWAKYRSRKQKNVRR